MWCVETNKYSRGELRNGSHQDHCDQYITIMRPNDSNLYIGAKRARKKVIEKIGFHILRGEKDVFNQSSIIHSWLTQHMMNGCLQRSKFIEDKKLL